jgi:tryptophan synthase alpha chain
MRLRDVTHSLKESGDKALVAFFTAGYPDEDTFRRLVLAADTAGCDLIEIGIPFSDPIADGPLIQESSKRALDNGVSPARSIELAGELAQEIATPLLFMSYYNPILHMGNERFAELALASGVSGVIIPDLPLEESEGTRSILEAKGMGYVDLIAPTSSEERIEAIAERADGFLYLVSVAGVTGVRVPRPRDIETFVGRVREKTRLPLYVGFGISGPETAVSAVRHSDGVIIGSALIKLIMSARSNGNALTRVGDFLQEVKSAIGVLGEQP